MLRHFLYFPWIMKFVILPNKAEMELLFVKLSQIWTALPPEIARFAGKSCH